MRAAAGRGLTSREQREKITRGVQIKAIPLLDPAAGTRENMAVEKRSCSTSSLLYTSSVAHMSEAPANHYNIELNI